MCLKTWCSLCGKGKRSGVLTKFAEVLSVAQWPSVKRQNMSGGVPLTHKVYLADGAHPCLNGTVHFFLMGNIALWIYKCFGTPGEGAVLHFEEEPPTLYPELEPKQLICLGLPFFPTNCPQQRNSPPSNGLGLKWKRLLKR